MLTEQLQAFDERRIPGGAQLRIAAHIADRHAHRAQAHQEGQPGNIPLRVLPPAARIAMHRCQQSGTLVVTQRVCAEAKVLRHLRD